MNIYVNMFMRDDASRYTYMSKSVLTFFVVVCHVWIVEWFQNLKWARIATDFIKEISMQYNGEKVFLTLRYIQLHQRQSHRYFHAYSNGKIIIPVTIHRFLLWYFSSFSPNQSHMHTHTYSNYRRRQQKTTNNTILLNIAADLLSPSKHFYAIWFT